MGGKEGAQRLVMLGICSWCFVLSKKACMWWSWSHRILCEIQISNLNTHKLWVKGMWRKRTKI